MAHGQRDDSDVESTGLLFTQADMAEHAVRLGSPYAFYRSGALLYAETWRNGLQGWGIYEFLAGSYGKLSSDYSLSDGISFHLYIGNAVGATVLASRTWVPMFSTNLGLQYSFAVNQQEHLLIFYIEYQWLGLRYIAEIQYNPVSKELQYRNDAGAYVVFAEGVDDYNLAGGWTTAKMVIDMADAEYIRFFWGGIEYPLSDIPFHQRLALAYNYMMFPVGAERLSLSDGHIWMDNIIITTEEPD